jgi:hypothetical protein
LVGGANITVTIANCGFQASTVVTARSDAAGAPPRVVQPLYGCARAVGVQCAKGSWLQVQGDSGAGFVTISALVWASQSPMTVNVSPFLVQAQKVRVRQIGCTGSDLMSSTVVVQATPKLAPLSVPFLVEGMTTVTVSGAVEGAGIEVWSFVSADSKAELIGTGIYLSDNPVVALVRPLTTADSVWLLQSMCGHTSSPKDRVPVQPGSKTFNLTQTIYFLSQVDTTKAVEVPVQAGFPGAQFTCNFADGSWEMSATVVNTDPKADFEFTLGFTMPLAAPASWGQSQVGDLAAANNGLPNGYAALGIQSTWNTPWKGQDNSFMDPTFWQAVLAAPDSPSDPNQQFFSIQAFPNQWVTGQSFKVRSVIAALQAMLNDSSARIQPMTSDKKPAADGHKPASGSRDYSMIRRIFRNVITKSEDRVGIGHYLVEELVSKKRISKTEATKLNDLIKLIFGPMTAQANRLKEVKEKARHIFAPAAFPKTGVRSTGDAAGR